MCNCNKSKKSITAPAVRRSQPRPEYANAGPPELTIEEGETLDEKCRTMGEYLGLGGPVPVQIMIAAIENPSYAYRLLDSTNSPDEIRRLLDNPPPVRQRSHTNMELVAKAGRALVRWGLSGFSSAGEDMLLRRETACLACPHLAAPKKVLQKLSASAKPVNETGKRTGNKICTICGCVVKNKMRLATDTCPDEVPETPGVNRWGEGLAAG
ncbi:MAG: hypothetical protein FD123_3813 [Bacteroidetes bacterium]|nr:MAG: hypothetical protein FD123_3813 [Bacteroidota bacterium]